MRSIWQHDPEQSATTRSAPASLYQHACFANASLRHLQLKAKGKVSASELPRWRGIAKSTEPRVQDLVGSITVADQSLVSSMYKDGKPSSTLGNQDPDKILATYPGNHEAALIWGEDKHREAYVEKYGYKKSLDVIDGALKTTPTDTKEAKSWADDMQQYRADLLGRLGS